jgi:hypothetical protein
MTAHIWEVSKLMELWFQNTKENTVNFTIFELIKFHLQIYIEIV